MTNSVLAEMSPLPHWLNAASMPATGSARTNPGAFVAQLAQHCELVALKRTDRGELGTTRFGCALNSSCSTLQLECAALLLSEHMTGQLSPHFSSAAVSCGARAEQTWEAPHLHILLAALILAIARILSTYLVPYLFITGTVISAELRWITLLLQHVLALERPGWQLLQEARRQLLSTAPWYRDRQQWQHARVSCFG
jgi:hypothetical protein